MLIHGCKKKREASGWPRCCETLEQKRDYIQNYNQKEGIRLDVAKIQKNPGRKAAAKLMLNRYFFHIAFFYAVIPPLLILFSLFYFLQFLGEVW